MNGFVELTLRPKVDMVRSPINKKPARMQVFYLLENSFRLTALMTIKCP